jgi:hypothetical protein
MTAIGHSERSRGIPLQSCLAVPRDPSTPLRSGWRATKRSSFLNDFGILDHGNSTTLCELSLDRDRFAAGLGELLVDWLMFANYEICFSLADDTDWSTTLDALRPAGLAMFFADRVMIDVAHHIHHFAGHFF